MAELKASNVYFYGFCHDCGTRTSKYESREEAIAAWNKRIKTGKKVSE